MQPQMTARGVFHLSPIGAYIEDRQLSKVFSALRLFAATA